eukprot:751133-Hanusia_phi.AAC.3
MSSPRPEECNVYADITTRMIFLNAGDKTREQMTKETTTATLEKASEDLKLSGQTGTSSSSRTPSNSSDLSDGETDERNQHDIGSPISRYPSELKFLHDLEVFARDMDQDSIASAMSTPTSLTPVHQLSRIPSPLIDLGQSQAECQPSSPSPSSSRFKVMNVSLQEVAHKADIVVKQEVQRSKAVLLQASMPESKTCSRSTVVWKLLISSFLILMLVFLVVPFVQYSWDLSGIPSCSDRSLRSSALKFFDLEAFRGRNSLKRECISAKTWQEKYVFALSKQARAVSRSHFG